jgi:hypothetical protein
MTLPGESCEDRESSQQDEVNKSRHKKGDCSDAFTESSHLTSPLGHTIFAFLQSLKVWDVQCKFLSKHMESLRRG